MKKKSLFKLLLLSIVSLMSLTSCAAISLIYNIVYDIFNEEEEYQYKENTSSVSLSYAEGKAGNNATLSQFQKACKKGAFPSIGENNLLVIPVYFTDFNPDNILSEGKEKAKENIYNAFFGEASDTGWESLKSFYYKSSYGALNVSGMVTDWCPLSTSVLQTVKNSSYSDCSIGPLREAVKWFKENYPEEVSSYDLDQDGNLDGVVLIYANDYYSSGSYDFSKLTNETKEEVEDLLWAFTTWDTSNPGTIESPNANVYMWASYDFLWDGNYSKSLILNDKNNRLVDAHTYIHEFGHMMGLDDYYTYDNDDDTSPLGGLDMMDNNIGDHNAYSKYLLGWLEPDLITEAGSYELSALEDKPMALLVPKDMNDFAYSAYDEYLLIEFYSPTCLNYADAKSSYSGSYPRMFSSYGVKILHVDSRMIFFDDSDMTYSFTKIIPELTSKQKLSLFASNTPSCAADGKTRLISLLSRGRINDYFKTNGYATNDDLYVQGTKLSSFTFDTGEKLAYTISIDKIDTSARTVVVTFKDKQ